ncbi:MAG: hypothetical protein QXH27_05120 [Candidatus Micrarchaeia archaeon]
MTEEKKISTLPSGFRKKVEKAKEEKKAPPAPFFPEEERELPEKPARAEGAAPLLESDLQSKVTLLALVIALASLALAYFSFSGMSALKAEAKAVAQELRALRDAPATFTSQARGEAVVSFDVPVSEALQDSFEIPLRATLPIEGAGKANLPFYGVVDVKFNGTAHIDQSLRADPSQIPPTYKLTVRQTAPLTATLTTTVKPGEAWPQLDRIIQRLEAAGG